MRARVGTAFFEPGFTTIQQIWNPADSNGRNGGPAAFGECRAIGATETCIAG
jgi:hypothetical protein